MMNAINFLLPIAAHAASSSKIDFTNPDLKLTDLVDASGNGIAKLIGGLVEFLIPLAGVVAVIVIIAAGFVRIVAGGNAERVKTSGELMWGGIMGLGIALTSVLLLNTFNPNLTLLSSFKFKKIEPKKAVNVTVSLDKGGPGKDGSSEGAGNTQGQPGNGKVNLLGIKVKGGIPIQNIDRLRQLYGSGSLTTIKFQGKDVEVHSSAAADFIAWSDELDRLRAADPTKDYRIASISGAEDRANVNSPGTPSLHSFGIAVDINAGTNANGSSTTDMPRWFIESAYRNGFRWGGQWNSDTSDPMHFERIRGGGFYRGGVEQTSIQIE